MAALQSLQGSTSRFLGVRTGVVLKCPVEIWTGSTAYKALTEKIANNFLVEQRVLDILGQHPRIVKYLGWQDKPGGPRGILLAEASHGSLQKYLDNNNDIIPLSLRKKWCRQAAESIAHIHRLGIVHSDLYPDNFLIYTTTQSSLDLWLYDFGGSTCEKFGLDGGQLPDSGFYDPRSEPISTKRTDIFSLASVLYTILTGDWPYRCSRPFRTGKEMEDYMQKVDDLFAQEKFPDMSGLWAGDIILKCWMNEYTSADDALKALDLVDKRALIQQIEGQHSLEL